MDVLARRIPEIQDFISLKIFHVNIQSLRNKLDFLDVHLKSLGGFDVVAITEHWLEPAECETLVLEGYIVSSFYARKHSIDHGGVLILTGQSVATVNREDIVACSVDGVCEFAAVEIPAYSTLVITVYRENDRSLAALERFFNILDRVFKLVRFDSLDVVVNGDQNVWFLSDAPDKRLTCNYFSSFGLFPTINSPTRGTQCLDNIFINRLSAFHAYVDPAHLSDHHATILSLSISSVSKTCLKRLVHPITLTGKFMFFNFIQQTDWEFISDATLDVEEQTCILLNVLVEGFYCSFPGRLVQQKGRNIVNVSWFDKSLKEKRQQFRLIQEICSNNPSEHFKDILSEARARYRRDIRQAKRRANDNFLRNAPNRSIASWQLINSKRKVRNTSPDVSFTADSFNTFFANVSSELSSRLPSTSCKPTDYLTGVACPQIIGEGNYFDLFSEAEVRDAITSLKNKKSSDVFGLTVEVIKSVKSLLIPPLTKIFNRILEQGTFPSVLKVSKLVPIFKTGDPLVLGNYRPIACVPILSKVFESLLKIRLTTYFEENSLFSSRQFGFRSGRSTVDAVLELTEFVIDSMEHGSFATASMFDVSKAFDCVDPEILASKLQYYRVSLNFINIIKSYLSNRKIVTSYGGAYSRGCTVNLGIVQGSIIGPTLFLIAINDLPDSVLGAESLLFADDTTILIQSRDPIELQDHLQFVSLQLSDWFASNALTVNDDKTQVMYFSYRSLDVFASKPQTVKFLGVWLDSHLTWEMHVNALSKKLSKNIFVIRNLTGIVSTEVLLLAYYSLFQSIYSYCLLAWGHSVHLADIFALQRRVIRIMTGRGYRDDVSDAFVSLGVLTVPSMYILVTLTYFKRHIGDYIKHSDVHLYNTRNRGDYIPDFTRLSHSRDAVNFYGPRFYNRLPVHFHTLPDSSFGRELKTYLVERAYSSIGEFLSNGHRS